MRLCFPLRHVALTNRVWVGFVALTTAAAVQAAETQTVATTPEKIALWPGPAPVGDGTFETTNASLTVHQPSPEKANGAAVVICPGGGYGGLVVGPEGHGIAQWLNQHGIAGIVLEYRLPGGRPFVPLLDAQRAIRTVRARAKEWKIDPNRIGIIGFSAGGHLASTAGTHFDGGDPQAADPIDRVSCRPDFMILVYPVITMNEKTHGGSKANLLGRDPKPELLDLFSNEKQVTAKTPPAFLAHAQDDTVVTPDNSRVFYEALKSHQVAAEYLQLPSGGHGLNGYQGPMWDAWQTESLAWLSKQKMIPDSEKPIRNHTVWTDTEGQSNFVPRRWHLAVRQHVLLVRYELQGQPDGTLGPEGCSPAKWLQLLQFQESRGLEVRGRMLRFSTRWLAGRRHVPPAQRRVQRQDGQVRAVVLLHRHDGARVSCRDAGGGHSGQTGRAVHLRWPTPHGRRAGVGAGSRPVPGPRRPDLPRLRRRAPQSPCGPAGGRLP